MNEMADEYYKNREPTTPTAAEMILLLGFWLKLGGYILATKGWEELQWGTYNGADYKFARRTS